MPGVKNPKVRKLKLTPVVRGKKTIQVIEYVDKPEIGEPMED